MPLVSRVVDAEVLSKSVRGLAKHVLKDKDARNANETQPFSLDTEMDLQLFLIINVRRNMTIKNGTLPLPLPLPHGGHPGKICLFSKDEPSSFYASLAPRNLTVIGMDKLRKEYKPFEAKRQLLAAFDLFLADKRILRMLPPLLGKGFFIKKKLPIPVKLPKIADKKSFLKVIEEASATTPLYLPPNGRCISIKVATLDMPARDIEENIMAVLPCAIKKIPGGSLNNVQSIHIKSTTSTALPLYSASSIIN